MGIKHIIMPDLGESVTEATVTEWLIKPGDQVNKYDPLLEAQSDKVVTEIPSEFDGEIVEILVEAGEIVPIGTKLLKIEVEGVESDEEDAVEMKVTETEAAKEDIQEALEPDLADETPDTKEGDTTTVKVDVAADDTKSEDRPKARYSPAVVRIAQERDIDLKQVTGTGKHGRITRKDIQNFDPASVKPEPAAVEEPKAVQAAPAPKQAAPAKPAAQATETTDRQTVVRADGVRRLIAENITRSVNEIPHAWLTVEADVTNIVKLRNGVKNNFKKEEGIPLSFFPFFVKAVAQALKNHPLLNASWDDGNIIYNKDINISIAVATDDHLYVPVIKNADGYSISGITKEIDRMATDARNGRLKADDMKGGTITVNNTGSFGSVSSMGIINHPQAAILQVEAIQEKIVPTADGFKKANMVNLCLSIDHRLLDGLQAGRFLANVKENLSLYNDEANIY